MSSILQVQNLTVKRGAEMVLDALSLDLVRHQVTGITGPNGGGKSTFFECLTGLFPVTAGSIRWDDKIEMSYLAQQQLPRKVIPLCVSDFVEMGTWGPPKKSKPVFTSKEAMNVLELHSISKSLISEISGGQWRRALLARALVQPADIYLMDEPFNQLDLEMEGRVGHILKDLSRNHQKTFFVISHDWAAMDHYFDKLLFVNKRLLAEGTVREVSDLYMNWAHPEHHKWMHPS